MDFADKPDVDFRLLGFTDVDKEDFVYFKTPGGNWVASAVDEQGRVYMIDEIGDLYYDTGNPEVGMYMVGAGLCRGCGDCSGWAGLYG